MFGVWPGGGMVGAGGWRGGAADETGPAARPMHATGRGRSPIRSSVNYHPYSHDHYRRASPTGHTILCTLPKYFSI